MDFVTIIIGGLVVAAVVFLLSAILGLVATGIVGFAFPNIGKRGFAKTITAVPPIMMCVLVALILFDKSDSALSTAETTSIPMYAVGAVLALLVAWPMSYLLVSKLWRLKALSS